MNFKTFCLSASVGYVEKELDSPYIRKIYEINNPDRKEITAIPDGCLDLQFVWKDKACQGYLCGSFAEGHVSPTGTYRRCFGIKLQPGVTPPFFHDSVGTVIDSRYPLYDFWDFSLIEEELTRLDSFESRMAFILDTSLLKSLGEFQEPDSVVNTIISEIESHSGSVTVSQLTNASGYSQRHLSRLFKENVGFSIKKFSQIIRVQRAIDILGTGDEDAIYEELGYYDQSHFINDFRQFTSYTPLKFLQKSGSIAIV